MHWLTNTLCFFLVALLAVSATPALSQGSPEPIPPQKADPHYTDVGFFDIHVCR